MSIIGDNPNADAPLSPRQRTAMGPLTPQAPRKENGEEKEPAAQTQTNRKNKVDEVDQIVAAWQQERPDLQAGAMEVFSRITRLARLLDIARKDAFATHDLEPWEFDVLSCLRRAGDPYSLTPGTLMTQTLVSSGTMTNRIDRLEDKNLVIRTPYPGDRRAVLVTLTDEGMDRVDGAMETLLEVETELLSNLSENQKNTLSRLLAGLLRRFEEH